MDKDIKKYIIVEGANVHNLKNVDAQIPKNKLVLITGLSGSGKSSLAFDTLFAEGQRRYIESLSSYARQFLGRMNKPNVKNIHGICPAIAIEQKSGNRNPRSTVGTSTEIYEYLKLLYARIGKTYSPKTGNLVRKHTVEDVLEYINHLPVGEKIMICASAKQFPERSQKEQLSLLLKQGYSRILLDDSACMIEDVIDSDALLDGYLLVVDRMIAEGIVENNNSRIADSVETAFFEGDGSCVIVSAHEKEMKRIAFSNKFELDGQKFIESSVNMFTFNNPFGACPKCEGFGSVIGIDEDLVVPDKNISVYDNAVNCWRGEKMSKWKEHLVMNAYKCDFPIHKPYFELNEKQKQMLWDGTTDFEGIYDFFSYVDENSYKIQYRVMKSRYTGKTTCPICKGTRLRKDASYVKIEGKSIVDLVVMPIGKLTAFFQEIKLEKNDYEISKRLLVEIQNRLQFLLDVGLEYLTLNRASSTLSGGESQRIVLATSLGSSLVGSMYILDEPSIGLHPRDIQNLIKVVKNLRDIGNTVIMVEHDEEIIRSADYIIDVGPLAGNLGGEIVFQGDLDQLLQNETSLTALYLNQKKIIEVPKKRREWKYSIEVTGARENNLKGVNVGFPLNIFTVVTGVSGSGKTSLVRKTLYIALKRFLDSYGEKAGEYEKIAGDVDRIEAVEYVDQNPIGRSSRSNPATYVKAYDDIRALFANQKLSKVRGYKPGYFSFNVPGGRCEECEGEGVVKISMQFMADVYLECEECGGKRFQEEVLDVTFNEKTIVDILNMTINEAVEFFRGSDFFGDDKNRTNCLNKILSKLGPLQEVGMGYVKMGQSSATLSGGEAQRVKLAFFLGKGVSNKNTLFIFDEPTTGLHFDDIHKLHQSFEALVNKGHSLVVIEHNPDLIKCADWVIDLGPEGGANGGALVFEGTPEDIVKCKKSYTGKFLVGKV